MASGFYAGFSDGFETMSYITTSGTLTGHTVWTAGTYYVNGLITLGNYNLTFDCTDGDIIVKPASGLATIFNANGSGYLLSSGTYETYITSINDNSLGLTISGSSGAPQIGDCKYIWKVNGTGACVDISNLEVNYVGGVRSALAWTNTANRPTNHITMSGITFKNNSLVKSTGAGSFLGHDGSAQFDLGTVILKDIYIDSTNSVVNDNNGAIVGIRPVSQNVQIENVFIDIQGTYRCGLQLLGWTGTNVWTLRNSCIYGDCHYGTIELGMDYDTTMTIDRCIAVNTEQTNYESPFVAFLYASAILDMTVRDSLFGKSIYSEWYMGLEFYISSHTCTINLNTFSVGHWNTSSELVYYNTNTNSAVNVAEHNTIFADPQLGNLPTNTAIASGFIVPDGYAVTNRHYFKQGSDTYDNLGIDENQYSSTGYPYRGSELITPGIQYKLTSFTKKMFPYGILLNSIKKQHRRKLPCKLY